MTRRIEATRMRTVLAGLTLALIGALTLFISPDGVAFADTNREKCASDGAVADAANNPGLVSDCATLLDSKKVLQGKGKDGRKLNWSSSLPMSQWEGVGIGDFYGFGGVNHSGLPNRVTDLDLNSRSSEAGSKKLRGKIPKRLADLSELRELDLFDNELRGRIRPQLGNLTELIALDLEGNNLTGKIPKGLGDLSNLKYLIISHNQLSGKIPKSLGKLTDLEVLFLRTNRLTGEIPKSLGELPKLRKLELYKNKLTGCVPVSLKNIEYFGHTAMYDHDNPPPPGYWSYSLPWCS